MTEIIQQNIQPTQSLFSRLNFKPTKFHSDFLCGSFAGLAVVLTGHPLDTIKVRMQMLGTGFRQTFSNMLKMEGTASLYKGIASPLYSSPLLTAVSFASYEMGNRMQGLKKGDQRTLPNALISGAWAGFVYAFAVTPIDLLKTRMQMEGVGEHMKSTKITTLTRSIIRQDGLLGLNKGLVITLIRDVPSIAAQFGVFEVAKTALNNTMGEGGLSSFLAGAVGTFFGWIAAYPQDMVKTKIQYSKAKLSIMDCSRQIYNTAGFRGFWVGITPCLMRALVTGATRYLVYDKSQEFLFVEERV